MRPAKIIVDQDLMTWKDFCDGSVKYKEHTTKQYDSTCVKKESVYNTLRPKQKALEGHTADC